jgi:hypothetical protein
MLALLKTSGFKRGGAEFSKAHSCLAQNFIALLKTAGFRRGAAKPILDDFQGLRRRAVKEFQTAIYKSFRLQFNKKKPKMEVSRSASPKTSGFKHGCLA